MLSPVYRPLTASVSSPRSTPSNGNKHMKHNVPKHPHGVLGENRAKHQAQAAGSPHTRHLLPEIKRTLQIIGSIRPPSAPKPRVEVLLPSREPAPAFTTYSPFDPAFPMLASAKPKPSARAGPVAKAAVAPVRIHHHKKAHTHRAANDHSHHANNRHLKQMPTEKHHKLRKHHGMTKKPATQTKATSVRTVVVRRMRKEHAHHIPRQVGDKKPWHLAGWVTYTPFDVNFDRVCKNGVFTNAVGVPSRQRKHKTHAHHTAGRPHHIGHHQAHHQHHGVSPATKAIANYYTAAPTMVAFPRMSPMAPQTTGNVSFFMPPTRMSMTTTQGSVRAYTPTAPPMRFSSGFAW